MTTGQFIKMRKSAYTPMGKGLFALVRQECRRPNHFFCPLFRLSKFVGCRRKVSDAGLYPKPE